MFLNFSIKKEKNYTIIITEKVLKLLVQSQKCSTFYELIQRLRDSGQKF